MKFFSTFTGIGGFEVGIYNAYRSKNRRIESNQEEINKTGERLVAPQGENSSAEERRASERNNYATHERPLRPDVPSTSRGEESGVRLEKGSTLTERQPVELQQPTCVGYSEIDKHSISVYEIHYPGVKNYGDITQINANELPDFDCLIGGFPCQAFSIAGKRRGFEDTRGTLFYDLARILQAKKPRLFVFENVKGLLSHDNGNTFKHIVVTLTELGYDIQWQVLNSKDFGVPQNRERVIIIGHLRGTPRPEVFPIGSENETYLEKSPTIIGSSQKHARVSTDGVVPTLSSAMGMGGGQTPMVINHGKMKLSEDVNTIDSNYHKGFDNHGQRTGILDGAEIRRLTPLECERLQGFPDNWTKYGCETYPVREGQKFSRVLHTSLPIPISDTQRYKMCGNAVTTNVIQAVFEKIL